jgi:diaminopimelate epimerase
MWVWSCMTRSLLVSKLEGTGNDFLVVDDRPFDQPQLSVQQRMWLCDRHRGVGADGVLTILNDQGMPRMHITNPDGSVPQMCGNGLRCVALKLVAQHVHKEPVHMRIGTDAGVKAVVVGPAEVTIDMGLPRRVPPHQFAGDVEQQVRAMAPQAHGVAAISMGNPHVVLFVRELPTRDEAAAMGEALEGNAQLFPERVNVEWAVIRDDAVDVLVWERGVGFTQACGTGACAVVAGAAALGLLPWGTHDVRLPGGVLRIRSDAPDASVWMTGPVRLVFEGTVHLP